MTNEVQGTLELKVKANFTWGRVIRTASDVEIVSTVELSEANDFTRGSRRINLPVRSVEIVELTFHLGAGRTTTQDARGRLDFLCGKPMSHVGVAAFAALATFGLLLTCRTHKIASQGWYRINRSANAKTVLTLFTL